ncbi:MAG: DUF1178 family protein [Ideonella sp. WA131b]|jgi:hypothetical protein|nr:DUF1178 family protein [Ideonella sp. WA131b]
MKVLDLCCRHDHAFEGWFGSDDEFQTQLARGLVACPVCDDTTITRRPSAPRLNLSGATAPPAPAAASAETTVTRPADLQGAWLQAVRELVDRTEDVGERFAEEARRIHYGEAAQRGIRGRATPEEREALRDEGIETVAIPVPAAMKGPVQ